MADKPIKNSPTKEEKDKIIDTLRIFAKYLDDNKIPPKIAVSAIMILTAQIAARSLNTDTQIIEQFKLSLLDARTRGATKQ